MTKFDHKIAVISDIHIGTSARAKELCPTSSSKGLFDEPFLDHFEKLVDKEQLTASALILSGDITSRAQPDEFTHASAVVLRVAGLLKVPENQIYFVPGNHDVDWAVLKADGKKQTPAQVTMRMSQRYAPITTTDNIFRRRNQASGSTLCDSPYAAIWQEGNLMVAALNTASHDKHDDKVHHGYAMPLSLSWLDTELSKTANTLDQLRVFVLHHHPIQYSDPYPEKLSGVDFSILGNASQLEALLHQHKFDLVIHGHKHVPHFRTHLVGSTHPLHVLGAGSFSVDLGSNVNCAYTNQFHTISVIGRPKGGVPVLGKLHSWGFAGPNGWIRGNHNTGMEYETGFGHFLTDAQIQSEIHDAIKAGFALGAKSVLWSQLVNKNPMFEFVPRRSMQEALRAAAKKLKRKLATMENGDFLIV